MGQFRIVIDASGGHGCDRKAKAGEQTYNRCARFDCPDCMAYELVQRFRQRGLMNGPTASARLIHWPGEEKETVDNLMTNRREKGEL